MQTDRIRRTRDRGLVSKYLSVYLNDHLMGATVAAELIERAIGEYKGTELGEFLSDLKVEIEADRQALLEIMDAAGAKPDQLKQAAGWVVEKVGRLKLNGELLHRSPLTPLVELEGLETGISGKLQLWRSLQATPAVPTAGHDLEELIARAESQAAAVELHRVVAAATALTA
jgi:hypothetical protein